MKKKTYLYTLLFFTILFVLFHFITWNILTKDLFIFKDNISIGGLGRMSYLTKSLTLREDNQSLSNKHINYQKNTKVDIITIGDSFSNGGAGGKNKYYQDYIATKYNLKVMNIQQSSKGFIETVLILNKLGILDKLKPKAIILESVERYSINRLAKNIDWNIRVGSNSLAFLKREYKHNVPVPLFINNLNYNALLYSFLYKYDDNAVFSKTYVANLSKKLFSCKDANKLLFYFEDLKYISLSTQTSINLLNNNLNKLQKILNEKNIKLYFLPAVDKYNLYSKYIENNRYKKSIFFEKLRELDKDYYLIDTKEILLKMLDNNISDVYYSDDTHWSFKGSKEIFKETDFNKIK